MSALPISRHLSLQVAIGHRIPVVPVHYSGCQEPSGVYGLPSNVQPVEMEMWTVGDLLEQMKQRLDEWWEQAAGRARCEGEVASITFELRGEPCFANSNEPIHEVSVEEKFYTDHLAGTVKRG